MNRKPNEGNRENRKYTTVERESARVTKERPRYVVEDFNGKMQKSMVSSWLDESYEHQDGDVIATRKELFRCTEPLFQPSFL